MPAGRPSKYKPEMCERMIALMSEGASLEEVAGDLGITCETLNQWSKNKPEFSEAKKIGVEKSKMWWLRQGRKNLQNKNFNYVGWYMNMKNRFGWRDKQETEVKGNLKSELVIQFSGKPRSA
jgi:transposase